MKINPKQPAASCSKNEMNHAGTQKCSNEEKPVWFGEYKKLNRKMFGSNNSLTVQENVLEIMRYIYKDVTICIRKQRAKRGAGLLKIVKAFIVDLHYKKTENSLRFNSPCYEELMAILLSFYAELVFLSFGKEALSSHCSRLAGFIKMIIGDSPPHIVDALLLLMPTQRKKMWDYFIPLLSLIVTSKTCEDSAETYMKLIILIKLWRKQSSPEKSKEVKQLGKSLSTVSCVSYWLQSNGLKDLGKIVQETTVPTTLLLLSKVFTSASQLKLLKKLKLTKKYDHLLRSKVGLLPTKPNEQKSLQKSGFFVDKKGLKSTESEDLPDLPKMKKYEKAKWLSSREKHESPTLPKNAWLQDSACGELVFEEEQDHNVEKSAVDEVTKQSPKKSFESSEKETSEKINLNNGSFLINKTPANLSGVIEVDLDSSDEASSVVQDSANEGYNVDEIDCPFNSRKLSPFKGLPGKIDDASVIAEESETSDIDIVSDFVADFLRPPAKLTRSSIHEMKSPEVGLNNFNGVKNSPVKNDPKKELKHAIVATSKSPTSSPYRAAVTFSKSPDRRSNVKRPLTTSAEKLMLVLSDSDDDDSNNKSHFLSSPVKHAAVEIKVNKESQAPLPSPPEQASLDFVTTPLKDMDRLIMEELSDADESGEENVEVEIISPRRQAKSQSSSDEIDVTKETTPVRKRKLSSVSKKNISCNENNDPNLNTSPQAGNVSFKKQQGDEGVTTRKRSRRLSELVNTPEPTELTVRSARKTAKSGSTSSSCTGELQCSSKSGFETPVPHQACLFYEVSSSPENEHLRKPQNNSQTSWSESSTDAFFGGVSKVKRPKVIATNNFREVFSTCKLFQNGANALGDEDYENEGSMIQLTPRMKQVLSVTGDSDESCEAILNSTSVSISSSENEYFSSESSSTDLDSEPDFAFLGEASNNDYMAIECKFSEKLMDDEDEEMENKPSCSLSSTMCDDIMLYSSLPTNNSNLSDILKLVEVAVEEKESNSMDAEGSLSMAVNLKSDCSIVNNENSKLSGMNFNSDINTENMIEEDEVKIISDGTACSKLEKSGTQSDVKQFPAHDTISAESVNQEYVSSPVIKLLPSISHDEVLEFLKFSEIISETDGSQSNVSSPVIIKYPAYYLTSNSNSQNEEQQEEPAKAEIWTSSPMLIAPSMAHIEAIDELPLSKAKDRLFVDDSDAATSSTCLYLEDNILDLDESDCDLKLAESFIHSAPVSTNSVVMSLIHSTPISMNPVVVLERLLPLHAKLSETSTSQKGKKIVTDIVNKSETCRSFTHEPMYVSGRNGLPAIAAECSPILFDHDAMETDSSVPNSPVRKKLFPESSNVTSLELTKSKCLPVDEKSILRLPTKGLRVVLNRLSPSQLDKLSKRHMGVADKELQNIYHLQDVRIHLTPVGKYFTNMEKDCASSADNKARESNVKSRKHLKRGAKNSSGEVQQSYNKKRNTPLTSRRRKHFGTVSEGVPCPIDDHSSKGDIFTSPTHNYFIKVSKSGLMNVSSLNTHEERNASEKVSPQLNPNKKQSARKKRDLSSVRPQRYMSRKTTNLRKSS